MTDVPLQDAGPGAYVGETFHGSRYDPADQIHVLQPTVVTASRDSGDVWSVADADDATSGSRLLVGLSGPASQPVGVNEMLLGRALQGVFNTPAAIVGGVLDYANNVGDLAKAGVGLLSRGTEALFGTGVYEPALRGPISRNYAAGMSYGEVVTRGILGSNPVTAPSVGAYDLSVAYSEGRIGDVAEGIGGLVTGAGAALIIGNVARGSGGVTNPEFFGPLIGKTGFKTSSEFAEAIGTRYQGFVDDAYVAGQRLEAKGLLRGNASTRLGDYVDRISANRLQAFLRSEGIPEGPNGLVQMNRWLRDPSGTGLYVRPDVRIPAAGHIYDATVGFKAYNSNQITRFGQYSSGDYITIIRPGPVGGSYSIVP